MVRGEGSPPWDSVLFSCRHNRGGYPGLNILLLRGICQAIAGTGEELRRRCTGAGDDGKYSTLHHRLSQNKTCLTLPLGLTSVSPEFSIKLSPAFRCAPAVDYSEKDW